MNASIGNARESGDGPAGNEDADDIEDGTICIACERKRTGGRPYKHGHASFCEKSIYFGLSEEQISSLKEERSNKLKDTKENILRRMGLSAKDNELRFPPISSEYPKVCDIPASLTSRHLSALVGANDANSAKAPKAVTIILRYLHMLAPTLTKGTNDVIEHEDNIRKLEFFREVFPRGSLCFTVPKEDPGLVPNPDYRIAEGCKLFLVRWELQTKESIRCPCCVDGKLAYKKTSFARSAVKPILDVDGKLAWAVGSSYKCDKCDANLHATDPELLQTLPMWMQQAYPVDSSWINTVKTFQIGRRLGALIETLFTAELGCDGHFVAYFLRKLYEKRYGTDFKLLVEAFEMHGEAGPTRDEWTIENWSGEFVFPVGSYFQETFEFSRKDEPGEDVKKSTSRQRAASPPGNRAGSTIGHSSTQRSPRAEVLGAEPTTPRKRAALPEDFAGHQSKLPRAGHSGLPVAHLPPEPPISAPLPIFVHGRGPMSPGAPRSPHTPPVFGGHQWPGYGPGPPFPMHYSPPPQYHPGYGFPVQAPPRNPAGVPAPAPSPASREDPQGSKGDDSGT
jgi:hypothetical protein